MIRNTLRIIMFATFITFVAALVWRSLHGVQVTSESDETAQRYLVYTASNKDGPKFAFDEVSGVVRIITYLHLPEESGPVAYDPARKYEYGVRLRVLAPDGKRLVYEDVVWVTTRKSKERFDGSEWELESSFYPRGEGTGEPADSRLLDVDLSAWVAPGRILEVESVGPDADPVEVDLVAFDRFERNQARIDWMMQTLGAANARDLADSSGLAAWTSPTPGEIRAMLADGWRRMTALETAANRTLVATDYRRAYDDESTSGLDVSKLESVAYNIRGPARLRIAATWAQRLSSYPLTLDVIRSTPDGIEVERRSERLERRYEFSVNTTLDESNSLSVEVPENTVASVRVSTDSTPARLFASVNQAAAIEGEHPATVRADGSIFMGPDLKKFRAWSLDDTLRFALAHEGQPAPHDAVLISLRRASDAPDSEVRYRFVGADVEGRLENDGAPSHFERIITDESQVPLAEATYHRLWIPPGATEMQLESENAEQWITAATLATDDIVDRVSRAPYDEPPRGLQWRYGPLAQNPWLTIYPEKPPVETLVTAQARLEPDLDTIEGAKVRAQLVNLGLADQPEGPKALGEAQSLDPVGRAARARVLERVDSNEEGTIRIALTSEDPVDCQTGPAQTLSMILEAPPTSLGRPYSLTWNSTTLRRRLVRTTYDRFVVSAPSSSGTLAIEYPGGGPPLQAWVDCKSAGAAYYKTRGVYELDGELSVRVRAPEEGTHYLNVVVYGPRGGVLDASLDGGAPRRKGGVVEQITVAERSLEWVASGKRVRLLGPKPQTLNGPFSFAIPLGSDLAAGTHTVTLERVEGFGGRIFVRFFEYR